MRSKTAIKQAQQKYDAKFGTLKARNPRNEIEDIKQYVTGKGETMNGFIYRLIKEEMKRNP